jgi:hypothetical protein
MAAATAASISANFSTLKGGGAGGGGAGGMGDDAGIATATGFGAPASGVPQPARLRAAPMAPIAASRDGCVRIPSTAEAAPRTRRERDM